MGILGEFNKMAKTKQIDQLHAFLGDELISSCADCNSLSAYIGMNNPRSAGAFRRQMHHNTEIFFASTR